MKKAYLKPELDLIRFQIRDVILTSNEDDSEEPANIPDVPGDFD